MMNIRKEVQWNYSGRTWSFEARDLTIQTVFFSCEVMQASWTSILQVNIHYSLLLVYSLYYFTFLYSLLLFYSHVFFYLPLFITSILFTCVLLPSFIYYFYFIHMCSFTFLYLLLLFYSCMFFYLLFIHYFYFIHCAKDTAQLRWAPDLFTDSRYFTVFTDYRYTTLFTNYRHPIH